MRSIASWSCFRGKTCARGEAAYPLIGQFLTTVPRGRHFSFCRKSRKPRMKVSHVTGTFSCWRLSSTRDATNHTNLRQRSWAGARGAGSNLRRLFHFDIHRDFCFATDTSSTPIIWQPCFYRCSGTRGDGQNLACSSSPYAYAFTGIMLSTIQGSGATNVAFRVELAAVTIT